MGRGGGERYVMKGEEGAGLESVKAACTEANQPGGVMNEGGGEEEVKGDTQ